MPGFGINRLWWTGGRYAYVSAHFDGFTDHILCIVDLQNITKPEIVSRWWLPGMNRAGGETSTLRQGQARRAASHDHRRRSRLWRLARRRLHDPRHQRPGAARSCSRTSTGRRRFPAARTRRCRCRAAISPSSPTKRMPRKCAKGMFHTFVVDVRAPENPVPISTLPTPTDRDYLRASARSVRTTCTRTGPARSRARRRSSRPTTTPACACSTSRTSSRRRRSPPGYRRRRAKLIDPRPERRARREDVRRLRDARRADVRQRLECRPARAAVRGVIAAQRKLATCPPWPPLPIR